GFTMTELMVVVAIIAVLAGILLTAMGGVRRRAMSTQTQSTMQEFAKACEAFQIEHNRYPGIIPEQVLADIGTGGVPEISGTENALLDLMGGARTISQLNPNDPDFDDIDACNTGGVLCPDLTAAAGQWYLKADVNRIGEGPKVDGRLHAPYFTPSEAALQAVDCQVGEPCPPDPADPTPRIPDLVDAWGQPIVYVRRARATGPLAGDAGDSPPPQFFTASMTPYTTSEALGKFAKNQSTNSILNSTAVDSSAIFAQILRHPGFGTFGTVDEAMSGTARGAFILFSAGPDGIYFSKHDGPGTPGTPVDDIVAHTNSNYNTPRVVDEYDDLRVFGGG
ncbi:MAG: type II secretion system protein, partial [Planctomycetota bacterium]